MKFLIASLLLAVTCVAQDLKLPDPLLVDDPKIKKVPFQVNALQWNGFHREETLEKVRTHIYGRNPVGRPKDLAFKVMEIDPKAIDGKATLKRVEISFSGPGGKGSFMVSLFVPNEVKKPVPAFLLICNRGYENIDERLRAIGAKITRIDELSVLFLLISS